MRQNLWPNALAKLCGAALGCPERAVSCEKWLTAGKSCDKILQHGNARVVELADSLDSGSSVHYARAGSSPASRTKKRQAPSGACRFLFPHPVGADYISARWQPQLRRCLRGRICNAPLHQCRWCTAPCRGGYQPPANLPGRAMRAPTWCTANSHRARRPLPASFFALASNVCS